MAELKNTAQNLKKTLRFEASTAVVLGSGLNDIADKYFEKDQEIGYHEIRDFPVPTVSDHKGKLITGYFDGEPCIILQGRVHYYEGNSSQKCVMPIRLLYYLGVKNVILTNASGGITLPPGQIMLINDHILFNAPSPLIGKNDYELGPRFPDMTYIYDPILRTKAKQAAKKNNIKLKEGVYLQCSGPQFETPSEIKMYKKMGADVVGMSTAIEAIAARHCGMKVLGLSFVANHAAGISKQIITAEDVNQTVGRMSKTAGVLLKEIVKSI
ncbi:MAG: purine-nucleoside phosphorylase [Clostridiales bacterium]|jgi:purine-nucleoside phosphorylase|nr:purine-nucleoside phosphorylase [Clostridiales bacterium]